MKGKNSNIVSLNKNVGTDKKIGLVKSIWNIEITDRFYEGCYNKIKTNFPNSNEAKNIEKFLNKIN